MPSPDSAVSFQPPAIAVQCSANGKTGPVSATYVTQKTCPPCPFRKNGCYAERSYTGIITRRLGRTAVDDPDEIAAYEAALIDTLPAVLDLRLHVVGDCPTPKAARTVAAAARRYAARGMDRYGKDCKVWTYTHAWQDVPVDDWSGVSVLASCETAAAARLALVAGYAPAVVVDRYPDGKRPFDVTAPDGTAITLIPCPEKVSGKKCVDCRLCMDAQRLADANVGIAFTPSNNGKQAGVARRIAMKVV